MVVPARRRSLPATMDPSALSSLLKPPLHPPPRGDLMTELPNLSETRQTSSEIEQSQPEIQRELDAETASVGTGVQTAELSEKSEGGREGGREERREGGTPTQAVNAPHPSLSHKLLMPPGSASTRLRKRYAMPGTSVAHGGTSSGSGTDLGCGTARIG
eukprot:3216488-Rhodomonas_salina.1